MLLTYRKYVLKLADRYGIDHEAALRMAEAKRQGKELLVVPMIPETVWDGGFKPGFITVDVSGCLINQTFRCHDPAEADEPTIITKPSAEAAS